MAVAQANLKSAAGDVLYLLREKAKRGNVPIQNQGHQLFWFKVLEADGAEPGGISITPI
jgi:hypothetical protein